MISAEGFTIAPDELTQKYDPFTALVFGMVYRARFMERSHLDASVASIAKTLGIGTTTVRSRLRILEQDGWIEREERDGDSSIYKDTGKWSVKLVGESETPQHETMPLIVRQAPTPTRDVAPPQRETLPKKEYKNTKLPIAAAPPGRAESKPGKKPVQPHIALIDAMADELQLEVVDYPRHVRDAKNLLDMGATPEKIRQTVRWVMAQPGKVEFFSQNPFSMTTCRKFYEKAQSAGPMMVRY